jgi:hypothetical protein
VSDVVIRSRRIEVPDSADAMLDWMEAALERGWSDGLPVVPPTMSRVEAMLAAVERDPQEVLGPVPPRLGVATTETVAIQAVMAGCKPEYFPVVLAAVEAMLDEGFNLNGIQATTHNVSPLCIVSGPIVQKIGMNVGTNLFGGGSRANGTIGRAIRLVLWNLGAGYGESGDKSVMGSPAKWTYCIGERQDVNPWDSFHEAHGFSREQSCVTMFGCEAPHHIMAAGQTVADALRVIAGGIASRGNNNISVGGETLVVLSPNILERLTAEHWTKQDVRMFLWDNARVPAAEVHAMVGPSLSARGGGDPSRGGGRWPAWVLAQEHEPGALLPVIRFPHNLHILTAGGAAGPFCAVCPGWGFVGGGAVTRAIRG